MPPLIKVSDFDRSDARREEKRYWQEMLPVVAQVVEQSFVDANMRNPTRSEVKKRVDQAKALVDTLRRDFKWGKTRIKDNLLHVLRAELVGLKLDLESFGRRASW